MAGGGLATAVMSDDARTQVMYFQMANGSVVEKINVNGKWTFQDSNNANKSIITGAQVGLGSSLRAVAYQFNGKNYRQLIYIDPSGFVKTINATSEAGQQTQWNDPVPLGGPVFPSAAGGLAACADPNPKGFYGMFVFFLGADQVINVWLYDFSNPKQLWVDASVALSIGAGWADPASGLTCSFIQNSGLNLYARKLKTSTVVQAYKFFGDGYNITDPWSSGMR
jgi:hypothetical protein